MKKQTWLLLELLLGQPVLVYLLRGALLTQVPVHYGWGPNVWNTVRTQNSWVAIVISGVTPLVMLAFSRLPMSLFIQPVLPWILAPKTTWLLWLFGLNWFVLLSLFTQRAWVNFLWQAWTVCLVIEFLIYVAHIVWLDQQVK